MKHESPNLALLQFTLSLPIAAIAQSNNNLVVFSADGDKFSLIRKWITNK